MLYSCLSTYMKHPYTAVPGAVDNNVILYFLQALWSHRIMQSLPHDRDVQPWGSITDLLFRHTHKSDTADATWRTWARVQPLVHSCTAPFVLDESLRRQDLYRPQRNKSMSLTDTICLWPGAHTCWQNMQLHKDTQKMKPFPACDKN